MNSRDKSVSRRRFVQQASGVAALSLALNEQTLAQQQASSPKVVGANDRIRFGAIGVGGRTRDLMRQLKTLPGTEMVAICDVYEPRLLQAAEMAGPGAAQHRNYKALLDDKTIDAVLIGSPDHWHKQMTIDAVRAGKDVYVEKPLTHSIEEGVEIVKVVEASRSVVQTGTQQRSWEHFIQGKEIIDSGKLGQITFVHTYWYQNYIPRVPPKNFQPDKLDWKQFLGSAPGQALTSDKYHLWRWYWDFGGGALTDLMTHWIDVIQWYMGTPAPLAVQSVGALHALKWECPDTVTCVLEYPKNYTVTYTGSMTSRIDDGGIEFRGTEATLKINRQQLAVYPESSKNIPGTLAPEPETVIPTKEDGTIPHLRNFLECIRSRVQPTANVRVAHEAARASHLGNIALRKGRKVKWNAQQERVES
ncbi:MAG: Gfo/Idh/MocA family oxidoreductase [Pyrinomonadaceae bacterium]